MVINNQIRMSRNKYNPNRQPSICDILNTLAQGSLPPSSPTTASPNDMPLPLPSSLAHPKPLLLPETRT
jgi:hypothetical protein